MILKIKRLHIFADIPKMANPGDVCFDVKAVSRKFTLKYIEYDTGLIFQPEDGYAIKAYPRSSISNKRLTLANGVGIIDTEYRGTITFRFRYNLLTLLTNSFYKVGDRIGQIQVIKKENVNILEVDEVSDTLRGSGGYGSTGN